MSVRELILQIYKTPGHPVAFSSPYNIYLYLKKKVPLKVIQNILAEIDSYSLHREYKRPKYYNPYYIYFRRKKFQADLIDISSLKTDNENISFLLVIIDIFSRKIWVYPLKQKTAISTAAAISSWVDEMKSEDCSPSHLLTDSGTEFVNKNVKNILRENNIQFDQSKNIHKCAIVERVNKTLQILIYKYLTDKETTTYYDELQNLVNSYNSRPHRSLNKMSPNEADKPENEIKVRGIHCIKYAMINSKRKKYASKFEVGDTVRIKTYAQGLTNARRSYLQQFHGEYFSIIEIKKRMPITMYIIKSMNDEEIIEGGFYANELTHVKGDIFKIEKIIKTKGKGRNKQHLVRWRYFDSRWDSWIKDSDIIRT